MAFGFGVALSSNVVTISARPGAILNSDEHESDSKTGKLPPVAVAGLCGEHWSFRRVAPRSPVNSEPVNGQSGSAIVAVLGVFF